MKTTGAERFIETLAKRKVLSDSVIKRLRDKVAGSSSVPSARALATFLVDKGHLSRADADEALAASAPVRRRARQRETAVYEPSKSTVSKAGKKLRSEKAVDPFAEPIEKGAGKDGKSKKDKKKAKYQKKKAGDNDFDTPLMLLGSGGLILLLLCGGGLLWLFFSESGDERLQAARTAYEAGSYSQAIQEYETFVEDFQSHEGFSDARVTLGIARIRQVADTNSEQGLKRALTEIPAIEDEEKFADAQEDLASVLPTIAKDLSEKADEATELAQINKYVDLTEQALVLSVNPKYVPPRLRDKQELGVINEVLARIDLRKKALEDLEATLKTMAQATEAGDTKTAYSAHAVYVKAHPEKAEDEALLKAVAQASQAEKAGIRFVEEKIEPKTSEEKTAVVATVATADLRRPGEAPTDGVAIVQFQGAAYAFDRQDGQLLWRRPLGVSLHNVEPLRIGADCLLLDSKRQELVRVNASTGKLVWRTEIGEAVVQPVLLGDRLLAAGESGKLHVVNAESGVAAGYVQFAQPLRSAPAVYGEASRVYLVGEHSSVYSLDAGDLSCLDVYYLGHAAGTVVAPPAVVLNRVAVFENDGAATSRLHLFGLGENGAIAGDLVSAEQAETRLPGLVTRAPEVFGKRMAVLTDSGHIGVYEVSSEEGGTPLTQLGVRPARRQPRSTRYSVVVGQELWVAGTGLARYSIQPAGNRLPVRDVAEPFRGDTFVHSLQTDDGVAIHVRRRRGRAGATVAATDLKTGSVYWETDIAAPAAGPPVASQSAGGLLYATAAGRVFLIDQTALKSGVADRVVGGDGTSLLNAGAAHDAAAVFAALQTGVGVGVGATTAPATKKIQKLELPGPLACPPVKFGEGWLALLSVGQAFLFDGATGAPLAAPFQPELAPRSKLAWTPPSVTTLEDQPAVVLSDGRQNLYTLRLATSPVPSLAPVAWHELKEGAFTSAAATTADHAAIATSDNKLMLFDTATLQLVGEIEQESAIIWGPYAAGGKFFVATAGDQLIGVDPADPEVAAWSVAVDALDLVGPPQSRDSAMLFSLRSGALVSRNPKTGEVTGQADLGQTLARGGSSVAERLAYSATDGALLLVAQGLVAQGGAR